MTTTVETAGEVIPRDGSLVESAGQPGRLRQAAIEIAANHPGASPDDVLLWAEARALPAA